MEEIQNKVPDPKEENLEEEEELLKEPQQDAVKASVAEEFGLVVGVDDEMIDKIATERIESSKKLSTAIKQKRSWRSQAQGNKDKPQNEEKKEDKPQPTEKTEEKPEKKEEKKEDINKIIAEQIKSELEERDFSKLELSDESKKELKNYAKATGQSIQDVLKSDYFTFLKNKDEQQANSDKASIGAKHKTPSGKDFSKVKMDDFDLETEEGKKGFAEYEDWLKNQK